MVEVIGASRVDRALQQRAVPQGQSGLVDPPEPLAASAGQHDARPARGRGRPDAYSPRKRYQKMSEARIDRLLAAALHQAIADLLPDRLDFYESYLRAARLARGWGRSRAAVTAVLSFLRHEDGEPYAAVMTRAAAYAASWWLARQPWVVRAGGPRLPAWLRLRHVGTLAKRHFEASYRGTKVKVRVHGRRLELEIRGSISATAANRRTKRIAATTSRSSRRWSHTTATPITPKSSPVARLAVRIAWSRLDMPEPAR